MGLSRNGGKSAKRSLRSEHERGYLFLRRPVLGRTLPRCVLADCKEAMRPRTPPVQRRRVTESHRVLRVGGGGGYETVYGTVLERSLVQILPGFLVAQLRT